MTSSSNSTEYTLLLPNSHGIELRKPTFFEKLVHDVPAALKSLSKCVICSIFAFIVFIVVIVTFAVASYRLFSTSFHLIPYHPSGNPFESSFNQYNGNDFKLTINGMAEGNVFISVDEVAEVKADVDFDIFPEYLRGQIHISEVKENGVYEILINTPPAPAGNNCLSSGDCSTFRSSSCERFYYNTCEIIVINLKLKLPKDKLKDLKIGASNFRISNEESKNLKLNVEKDLSLKTTNGRVFLKNFETESFSAKSSNGRIEMSNFKVKKSIVETSNGLVSIKNGEVEEDNSVESTNGRITVENFENGHLHSYSTFRSSNAMMIFDNANFNDVLVHTSNGRVTGTQMSVVTVFEAESTNGSIELQKLKMKSFNTRVKVQTSNGSVNLGLINFAGKFSLNTRNAKSDIVGDHIIFDSENKNKGHIEYGNQQELEVNTSNGKIKVNLL